MRGPERVGVVAMAYGTPSGPDEVEAFYTDIRGGRPPSGEQLAELQGRYGAIGGSSPLAERTEGQRRAIAAALEERAPGVFEVVLGNKHSAPSIDDAIASLAGQGITRAVGLVLAPHFSRLGVGRYLDLAASAGTVHGVAVTTIGSWHLEPAFVEFLAGAVRDARAAIGVDHKVLFTAHSLPRRALVGDVYADQLRESASAVAAMVGLAPWADWSIAWQSAGRTPEPWQGPDLLSVIADLGGTGRSEGVVVCAQGFVSDHLEVLYDLDVEARRVAEENGLAFARTRSLNADPSVMAALAERVVEHGRRDLAAGRDA